VVRLKETVTKNEAGIYPQPTTEQIIQEYLGERAPHHVHSSPAQAMVEA
jgi:hypothetical protein